LYTQGSFEFHEFHQSKMWNQTQKRCCIQIIGAYTRLDSKTDQVGLSNNNPHWNLVFRFLFFPNLIQVLRDLKETHPSLERLESDSSKSRETWKWLIQVSRDLKMTHPSLERLGSDSSKKSTSSKPLMCEASVT
jgi:hypothetical protein